MNPYIHTYYVNIRNGADVRRERQPLASGDKNADRFVVYLQDCGSAVDLTGAGVSGKVIRPDGQTVPLIGEVEDGAAVVTLDESCYAIPGEIRLTVSVSYGDVVQSVLIVMLDVQTSETSVVVDNGVIGTLTDLLAEIANMREATEAATAAADSANAAAVSSVRTDAAQGLTDAQQQIARDNISVYSRDEVDRATGEISSAFEWTRSYNVYNPVHVGLSLKKDGTFVENADHTTSDYIPVAEGDELRYQFTWSTGVRYDLSTVPEWTSIYRICGYDADKNLVEAAHAYLATEYIVPAGVAYLRVTLSFAVKYISEPALLLSSDPTVLPYEPYGATGKALHAVSADTVQGVDVVPKLDAVTADVEALGGAYTTMAGALSDTQDTVGQLEKSQRTLENRVESLATINDYGNMAPLYLQAGAQYSRNGLTVSIDNAGVLTINGTSTTGVTFELLEQGVAYATMTAGTKYTIQSRILSGTASGNAFLFVFSGATSVYQSLINKTWTTTPEADTTLDRLAFNVSAAGITFEDCKLAIYIVPTADAVADYTGAKTTFHADQIDGQVQWAQRTPAGSYALLQPSTAKDLLAFDTDAQTVTITAANARFGSSAGTAVAGATLSLPYANGYIVLDTATLEYKVRANTVTGAVAENEVLIAAYGGYGEKVSTVYPFTVNGWQQGMEIYPDVGTHAVYAPEYEWIPLPDSPTTWSDFVCVDNKLWMFAASSDETHTAADGKIVVYDMADMSLLKSMTHDFGHCNTVHYRGGKLLIGNLPGNDEYPAALYIIDMERIDVEDGTALYFADVAPVIVDLSELPTIYAGEVADKTIDNIAACWGDSNMGLNDIVYVSSQYNVDWYQLQLGTGDNVLSNGTYTAAAAGEFNGTYQPLAHRPFEREYGQSKEVIQGIDYAFGRIVTANGHNEILGFGWTMGSTSMRRDMVDMKPYNAEGSIITGASEGMCVNDGYAYQGYMTTDYTVRGLVKYKLPYGGGGGQSESSSLIEDAKINHWVTADKETFMMNTSAELAIFASYPTDTSAKIWHDTAANHYGGIKFPVQIGQTYTMAMKITSGELTSLRYCPYSYTTGVTDLVVRFVLSDDGYYSATFTPITETAYIHFTLSYTQAVTEANAVQLEDIRLFEGDSYEQTKKIRNSLIVDLGEESLSGELIEKLGLPTNPCEYVDLNEISMFSKGLCIGDSLTAGVFDYTVDGTNQSTTIPRYSWPTILKKLTGVDVTNLGVGGKTAETWYQAHADSDLSGYDFAIIQLGVNDGAMLGGWTDASAAAFGNIVTKLKAENNGIKIYIATIVRSTRYVGENYDSVSQGIRDFVAGLADSDVVLLDMALYSHTGDYTAYNQGHLTALGYARLAMDYKSYISWHIHEYKSDYANVQFIGTAYAAMQYTSTADAEYQ